MSTAISQVNTLEEAVAQFVYDPLGFVYFIFPWGEEGTPLADADGPDQWQIEVLESIRNGLLSEDESSIRRAVASGHGVGKTALTSWIILWFVSTRPHPQMVVTANTKIQLDTKTWRELAKWHKMARNADWFKWTATKFYHIDHPETWFASSIPWSKDRPEAFAGTHERHVGMLFDEASAVADIIYDTAEGAMTTRDTLWLLFGNPTQNTGRFRECFAGGRFAHRWKTIQVDSRTAKMADHQQCQEWIEDYGDDSDFVRVRVKGEFPRASTIQLIGEDLIQMAQVRVPEGHDQLPKVLGVDVARFGDDRSVIIGRQGPKIFDKRVYREVDTMALASLVTEAINDHDADMVFIDLGSMGAGVYDRVVQLGYKHKVVGVNFGQEAMKKLHYYNKRAEMWDVMRQWIRDVGCLPAGDRELAADLTGVQYGYDMRERLLLEKKTDMKNRGLASPDEGDALALTFAMPVAPREEKSEKRPKRIQMYGRNRNLGWMG